MNVFLEIMVDLSMVFVEEDFFCTFLKKRQKQWRYICAWIFFFFYHLTIMNMISGYIENFLGNLIGLSVVCAIAYDAEIKIRTMMIILAISLGSISEVIISIVILITMGEMKGDVRIYAMMAKIIFWVCVRALSILYKEKIEYLHGVVSGVAFIVAVGCNIIWSVIILNIAKETQNTATKNWALILVFVMLIFDITIFRVYTLYQERETINREKLEYAYQIRIYDKEIEQRKALMDEVHRTKHDFKNSMIYLQELLDKNPDEAKEFLNQYLGENIDNKNELSKSGNLAVDALINYKNIIVREKKITIHLESQIPAELPYESTDLSIILGNLLDNAIEATEKLEDEEEKQIFIKLIYQKKRLFIEIRNPYRGSLKKGRSGDYLSGKKDQENHGIGLKSVRKVVEKYDGTLDIHTENQQFQITIIL